MSLISGLRIGQSNVRSNETAPALNIESGLQKATDQTAAYLNEAKALYKPYAETGAKSLEEYTKLLTGGISSLQSEDQNFKDMLGLTEKTVMANKAVGGLLRSTGTAAALSDSTLKFQNQYYGDRLSQLLSGVKIGQDATDNTASIYDKLGSNQKDLASALAQIQIEREAMESSENAAKYSADSAKKTAETTGGLFGHGGFLGLGI